MIRHMPHSINCVSGCGLGVIDRVGATVSLPASPITDWILKIRI